MFLIKIEILMKTKLLLLSIITFSFGMTVFNGLGQSCPSGIEAYLRFEESGGTVFSDEINDHSGVTSSGNPISVSGVGEVGSALSFNGVGDKVDIVNSSDFNWTAADAFSIEFWVKYSELSATTRVMVGRDAASPSTVHWWIGTTTAGKIMWYIRDSNNNAFSLESPSALNNGEWHHVAATRNGSTLVLYIDGIPVQTTASFTGSFNASNNAIEVGAFSDDGTTKFYYEGLIDELAIYSAALEQATVTEHVAKGEFGIGYCDDNSPKILSVPDITAIEGETYTYDVNASGDPVPTYSLIDSPEGMTIDENTGIITWVPSAPLPANTSVLVEATNSEGTDEQAYQIYLAEQPDCSSSVVGLFKFDNSNPTLDFINKYELTGTASPTTGFIEGAMSFDGVTTALNMEDVLEPGNIFFDLKTTSSFSISYWMKSSATSGINNVAVGRRNLADAAPNDTYWWIGFDPDDGSSVFYATDYLGTTQQVTNSELLVNDGNWHMVTAVYDDGANLSYLYVDTVGISESVNFENFGCDDPLNIGWLNQSSGYHFNGLLDDMGFYSEALTESQVKQKYYDGADGQSICQENYLPAFISEFDTSALEEEFYRDTLFFNDLNEKDVVTPSISNKPEWLTYSYTATDSFLVLSGTPQNDEVGMYSFTIILNDGNASVTGTFNLTVEDVNDLPVIVSSPELEVYEDSVYSYTLKAIDEDLDETLTFTASTIPDWLEFNETSDSTAVLTGTPGNADADSTYKIVLTVFDGMETVTDSFGIAVIPVNDKPVITGQELMSINEDTEFTITLDDLEVTDVDNEQEELSIELLDGDNYTYEGTTVTPEDNFNGLLTVNLVVMDIDSTSETFEFEVTVVAQNDAPALVSDVDTVAMEKSEYKQGLEFEDAEGDDITVTPLTIPAWLTLTDNDTLVGTPASVDIGEHPVSIRISDGIAQVTINFTITVVNENDPPVFESVAEGDVLKADDYEYYEYKVIVSDEDGDDITVTAVEKPDWLTYNSADSLLSGTPDWEDANNVFNVVLQATDGVSNVEQKFEITVTNINSKPEITTEYTDTAFVGTNYAYTIKATDVDEDDDLTYTVELKPDWLSFTATSVGGTLTGVPTEDDLGDHVIILSVEDSRGDQATQQYTLHVKTSTSRLDNILTNLSFYPNPAQTEIMVDLAGLTDAKVIEIYDVTGKLRIVKSIDNQLNIKSIDVSSLSGGAYIIRIEDNDTLYLGKLMINK